MDEKKVELLAYINSVITQLENIKNNLDTEIENNCFTLSCIAWHMEQKSFRSRRVRRRGRLETDSDSDSELP